MDPARSDNLRLRALFAALASAALVRIAAAQNIPVTVGADHDSAVAALESKGIDFDESTSGETRPAAHTAASGTRARWMSWAMGPSAARRGRWRA